jgi:uncharacterized protein (DUF983 family)
MPCPRCLDRRIARSTVVRAFTCPVCGARVPRTRPATVAGGVVALSVPGFQIVALGPGVRMRGPAW